MRGVHIAVLDTQPKTLASTYVWAMVGRLVKVL